MNFFRARRRALFISSIAVTVLALAFGIYELIRASRSSSGLSKEEVAEVFTPVDLQTFPKKVKLELDGNKQTASIQYAIDRNFQEYMEEIYREYRPDYGAFVALDPETGRVLSLVSYVHGNREFDGNMALQSTFPSASVFKVVTAAAAIAEKNYSANTIIPFNGRSHTLYKRQVMKINYNRWTRYMTLRDAFARSVNAVFGKIGALTLGADDLRTYANRFGFNRKIASDVPLEIAHAAIEDDPWALAETASGFTRDNTMSPLHGALIAAAVVNNGIMMEPYLIRSVKDEEGSTLYRPKPKIATFSVDPETAAEIRELMRATVKRGTSKSSFRGFFRNELADLDVGGKTGSLTGLEPRGRYDWFVGFGDNGHRKLAVAALAVHERYWRVKAAYLARKGIERYFKLVARKEILTANQYKDRDKRSSDL